MIKFDLRLKKETVEAIKKEAEIEGRTTSAMARFILERYFTRYIPGKGGMIEGFPSVTIDGNKLCILSTLNKRLNKWSLQMKPTKTIPYDYIYITTSIGEFTIEWQSWKKNTSYVLNFNGDFINVFDSIDEAKKGFEQYMENIN